MKKLSAFQKIWLIRHARRAARRREDERARRCAKRSGQSYKRATGYWQGKRRRMWVSARPRPVPALLCFDQNFDETVEFISGLSRQLCNQYLEGRNKIRTRRRPIGWYDFGQLAEISPGAGLIVAAEFDRARILTRTRQMFTIDMHKWQPQPRKMLLSLGLLPLLGIDTADMQPDADQLIVPFRADTSVDMRVASDTLREVISLAASAAVIGIEADPLSKFRTFLMAIGEALNNTSDHAYPDAVETELPNVGRWWITGAVDPVARRLTFAVYDQGVTIPRAIPYGRRHERVRRFLNRLTGNGYDPEDASLDGQTLAAAVRVGISGTGLSHRGRGLGLMRDYIRNERQGRLRIISRNGEFVACSGRKDEYRTRGVTLNGTFVEWIVDL
ncbi:hypothetical protein ACLBWX_00930 [Methylobacterium sp. M6A4_1b]